jgi:hypothetical protein
VSFGTPHSRVRMWRDEVAPRGSLSSLPSLPSLPSENVGSLGDDARDGSNNANLVLSPRVLSRWGFCRETRFWRQNSLSQELRCASLADRVVPIELALERGCVRFCRRSPQSATICRWSRTLGCLRAQRQRKRTPAGTVRGEDCWLGCQRTNWYLCIVVDAEPEVKGFLVQRVIHA